MNGSDGPEDTMVWQGRDIMALVQQTCLYTSKTVTILLYV